MLVCDRSNISRWAWARDDEDMAVGTLAGDIREAEVGIPGEADIRAVAAGDSRVRARIRIRITGRLRRMTLHSSTRCWTTSEPSFRWIRRGFMPSDFQKGDS